MSGPAVVCIKRKRTEQAPDALLLERPGKRQQSGIGGVQYVRQRDNDCGGNGNGNGNDGGVQGGNARDVVAGQHGGGGGGGGGPEAEIKERRTFHLRRPVLLEPVGGTRRQKRKQEGVAMFVERSAKRPSTRPPVADFFSEKELSPSKPYATPAEEAPLKRPGRMASLNLTRTAAFPTHAHNAAVDHAVANSLHEFAQQVVAKENRPHHPTAMPRLPSQRSRELHRQRALRTVAKSAIDPDGDADMEDEADYVYDTYILAPRPSDDGGAPPANAYDDALGSVGYLVITDEDQEVWETYLEDEPSDKDWNSDEEDENAEDWYGADYPDEELASDDELFGRRSNDDGWCRARGAANDEEWDADTGNFSDEEEEKEYGRQMNPWKKMSSSSSSAAAA